MPKPVVLTLHDVLLELRGRRGGRSIEEMAGEIGVSFQYLARILSGERMPGEKILKWMGIRKRQQVWYERVKG